MKVHKRTVPLDMLSVEQDDVHLLMATHRQSIHVTVLNSSKTLFHREYSFTEFVHLFVKPNKIKP